MSNYLKILLVLMLGATAFSSLHATHNRAGEIRVEQIGDLTVRATVVTYTKASSVAADRDSVRIDWGDGNHIWAPRVNNGGLGEIVGDDMKMNIYIAEHTYPGRTTYTISMGDPNRIANIQNINFPNSDLIFFYIETQFTFLNPQFQGYNNTVVLLNPPIDFACVGRRFVHNPNAWDPDGDSLSFELIEPLGEDGEPVPNYELPDRIVPGPDNRLTLDSRTGELVWDSPKVRGEFNVAIRINEYRNGNLIGSTVRDMQITVRTDCETDPPFIEAANELCVIAGDTIMEPVIARVNDEDQLVRLSAGGGPMELDISPAVFDVLDGYQNPPLEGTFIWETHCNHIREQFYDVIFKAEDNSFPDQNAGLVDLHTMRIKVSGPPPENPSTVSQLEGIEVRWDNPYSCEETIDNYFNGFTVWRKVGPSDMEVDICGTDPADFGFTPIGFGVNSSDSDGYFFMDETAEKGTRYCYVITAEFALRTPTGNYPFNRVNSLPSEVVCGQLKLDIPLILKNSVEETDLSNGERLILWIRPIADDLDTLTNPGPYRFRLMSRINENEEFSPVPGADFIFDTYSTITDTSFIDSSIDTETVNRTYRVDFFAGGSGELFGRSPNASGVFLEIISANRENRLEWEYDVSWVNEFYDVFLVAEDGEILDSLGRSVDTFFVHEGLQNFESYCYLVRSTGTYYLDGIRTPFSNWSQVNCGIPIDTIPPCPPILTVENICTRDPATIDSDKPLTNQLNWEVDICDFHEDDIALFRIYYSPFEGGETELITELPATTFTYEHSTEEGIVGCYKITAIDTVGNVSDFSNQVCVNNCPVYRLPNAFTPNGDGFNDLFTPFRPYAFVDRVEFSVFNRWGNKVFETDDPELNWDGRSMSGSELAEGSYHYICTVYYADLAGGESSFRLSGFIQLIRD